MWNKSNHLLETAECILYLSCLLLWSRCVFPTPSFQWTLICFLWSICISLGANACTNTCAKEKQSSAALNLFFLLTIAGKHRQGWWMAKLIGGGIPEVTAATLNVEVTEIYSAQCRQSCCFTGCRWKHRFGLQFLKTMKDLTTVSTVSTVALFFLTRL